jgi:YgiT-type zinc finger domain-containing protein
MSDSERARRCYVCRSRMLPNTITHVTRRGDSVFVFERVPASVCETCGEATIAGSVLDAINRLVDERPAPSRTIEAPVYDLAAVMAGSR